MEKEGNQKVYKSGLNYNISMLPGNPKGLPDESFFLCISKAGGFYAGHAGFY